MKKNKKMSLLVVAVLSLLVIGGVLVSGNLKAMAIDPPFAIFMR